MPALLPDPKRRTRDFARLVRLSTWLASVLAIVLLSACSLAKLGGRGTPQGTVALVVQNRGFSDVIVYVIRSEGARGARVGSVNGGSTMTFKVGENQLQAGGLLQLQARAIGGRTAWISPTVFVSSGGVVKLDLIAVGTSDLSQSQLYLVQ